MQYHVTTRSERLLADAYTPVSVYLKIRDHFPESLLLESSSYNKQERAYSFICCEPIAGATVADKQMVLQYPDGQMRSRIKEHVDVVQQLSAFFASFSFGAVDIPLPGGGFFGHIGYDAVAHFESISLKKATEDTGVPDIRMYLYRYVIVFDHHAHTMYLLEHGFDGQQLSEGKQLSTIISGQPANTYPFRTSSAERATITDDDYLALVNKGIHHCLIGDVFQIVLSRRFSIDFKGDDFNVYRSLRSLNPSPYLFYFDYGNYRLFGSSPECQVRIQQGKAQVHPIAGTYRRTGDDAIDQELAKELQQDAKENAEHVMLVDLARNDLSKNYDAVTLTVDKQLQFFSNVIHIVSEVTGEQPKQHMQPLKVLADSFPAGTLSGAPKYKAMQLIDGYETDARGYYGGCIGYLHPEKGTNMAIMIRTFMSRDHTLCYQAGAGITHASVPEKELQEINHKLQALRNAIELAKTL